jgi:hypothetical protein
MGGCITNAVTGSAGSIFATCRGHVYVTGVRVNINGDYSADGVGAQPGPLRAVDALVDHFIVMVAAGDDHFMALTDRGKLFVWGSNSHGQLGLDDPELPYVTSPTEVKPLADMNVRFVATKGNFATAITDTGRLMIWGEHVGVTGTVDDPGNSYKPRLVTSLTTPICQVSMGARHVAALARDGNLYEWGDGTQGQLGQGDFNIRRSKPTLVSKLRKNVCHVEASFDYTVAITQDSRMFLWGSNGYSAPFEKVFLQDLKPIQAGAGQKHVVVLLGNGTVVTWGSRRLGQIGRNSEDAFTLDAGFLEWSGDQKFSQISVGGDQTIAIASGVPAPSLCSCGNGFYKHWYENAKYEPKCTPEQTACGDGACCAGDETCCRQSDEITDLNSVRSIENQTMVKSSFACIPKLPEAVCGPTGSRMACPKGFKVNLAGGVASPGVCRCEPDNKRQMSEKQLVAGSSSCVKAKPGTAPPAGNAPNAGRCCERKFTCHDDTCCPKGFTCCPTFDGYGCCQILNGKCCNKGCCAQGYECHESPESGQVCRKSEMSTALVLVERGEVTGQCGANKIRCPDSTCCKGGKSCCSLSDGSFGCCPYKNAVCCTDGAGCCQAGQKCDTVNMECVSPDGERVEMAGTPRNTPQRSEASIVRCDDDKACDYPGTCSGDSRCCPFNRAVFCPDKITCCPEGYGCGEEGTCKSPKDEIPRKLTRAAKQLPSAEQKAKAGQVACKESEKTCDNGKCCPRGTKCCPDPLDPNKSHCCSYASGNCCDNGCCAAGHKCNNELDKCELAGEGYPFLPWTTATAPAVIKTKIAVSAPAKCYGNERVCPNGECCPSTSTCCTFGMGEFGCCPQNAAKCCENGGCCPGGTECPAPGGLSKECVYPDGALAPQLGAQTPNSPSVEYDLEECWEDEQTCFDGGCCKSDSQTCCSVDTAQGPESVCCGFKDATCCPAGGCCPQGMVCTDDGGCLDEATGEKNNGAKVKGPDTHPIAPMAEQDCPDGSICMMSETCCSLGYDPEWDEEIFACCPFEDGVCCSEFEGCCPNSYMCDAETQDCVMDGKLLSPGGNGPTDPPPIYVCELPEKTQCPNGKCCEADEKCVQMVSGNYKCVDRGWLGCTDGKWACPEGLFCDQDKDTGDMMCSKEMDNDLQIKESLLAKYWGDEVPVPATVETSAPVCGAAILKAVPDFLKQAPAEVARVCGKLMECLTSGRKDCQFCPCVLNLPYPPGEQFSMMLKNMGHCRPTDDYTKTIVEYYVGCHESESDGAASCAAACSASQAASQSFLEIGREKLPDEPNLGNSHSPEVTVQPPPQTLYWYPKKLVPMLKAVRTANTTLPVVQAGKVCQHIGDMSGPNGSEDLCFFSNLNGHFAEKERERVNELLDEYKRRLCDMQECVGSKSKDYVFEPEDLDPCPCREKPQPPAFDADVLAGSDDEKAIEKAEETASLEDAVPPMKTKLPKTKTKTFEDDEEEEEQVVDEKEAVISIPSVPASAATTLSEPSAESMESVEEDVAASSGSPVRRANPKPRPLRTLVRPTTDKMMLASSYEDNVAKSLGDKAMLEGEGKEPNMANCSDATEAAVDLEGAEAVAEDAAVDAASAVTVTLNQMNPAETVTRAPGKLMD